MTFESDTKRLNKIRETVARTRAEQGLPTKIEDPVVLTRVAEVLRAAEQDGTQPAA